MYSIEFTYEEMIDSIKNIANQLSKSKFDPEIIISVNRGGCIPGIYLSHYIDKPHETLSIQFRNTDKGPNTRSIEKTNGEHLCHLNFTQIKPRYLNVTLL